MITLKWRLYKVLDTEYYYTFHNEKFWCIKADYVINNTVTDHEFIFQVTTSKMEEKTKIKLIERLCYLFPELPLLQIKNALLYDKDASIPSI